MLNEVLLQLLIDDLLAQGLIVPCPRPEEHIAKEQVSLCQSLKRKGYLGLYDTALRYLSILFLTKKVCINGKTIHLVFKQFLQCQYHEGRCIVAQRHKLKYGGALPGPDSYAQLKGVVDMLKQCLTQGKK